MQQGEPDILHAVLAACDAAAGKGAETVVLGCTCMSPIAGRIVQDAALPVIDPFVAALKFAETADLSPRDPRANRRRRRGFAA